jgi:hypothetical protein
VFDTRMQRKICGSKEEELTGEWRQLHSNAIGYVLFSKYGFGDCLQKHEIGG